MRLHPLPAALCAIGLLFLTTMTACAGSEEGGVATPAASSPLASSSVGPTAGGAVSPATAAQLISSYTDAATRLHDAGEIDTLAALYADDARMEDRAFGATTVGRDEIRAYWKRFFVTGPLSYEVVAAYTGRGCAAIESNAFSSEVALPTVEVFKLRGGRIAEDYVYYYDGQVGHVPAPLETEPGPADTVTVSRRVAAAYLSSLRSLDARGLASLYAPSVVYRDTAHARRFVGVAAAAGAHAQVFAMKGVRFAGAGIITGPGWAVVMWRRTDSRGRQIPFPDGLPAEYLELARRPTIAGATLLEIRDGRIGRETIYCDHLRTRL
jgi:hypothetical protein